MQAQTPVHGITELKHGDHICGIYDTDEEHRNVIVPFLRKGLEQNEKLLYILDTRTKDDVITYLKNDDVDVEHYLSNGQLNFLTFADTYVKGGAFDPDRMVSLTSHETQKALDEGYSALRVTSEMSWALRGYPGSERLLEYEIKVDQFFQGKKCIALCQYDRRRFAPEIFRTVLLTHPFAVIGTRVYDNFYYVPPKERVGGKHSVGTPNSWIPNLVSYTEAKEALQQSEKHLKHFNEELEKGIADRTEKLNALLEEKVLLLREVHHRVKNNLQVILSLIRLQSPNIKDQKLLDTMGDFQNRIMAMAHVHERMCRAEDISRIDLSEIVTFMGTSLFKSFKVNPKQIRLNVEIKDLQINIDSAIPISLIINELISNSIKHAFPKGTMGEITIAGHHEANTLILSFKDTGIGIPKDLDWMRSKQSLGHRLVVGLVQQLNGTIELDRTTGTAFNIVVKEK